jgi:2-iminoacetate synthase
MTDLQALDDLVLGATPGDVERALGRDALSDADVAILLSPAAAGHLEAIATRSASLTRRRFGRTMQLYAPLYLSNECVNRCTYCGFSNELDIARMTLSPDQVVAEADWLRSEGFRHLLLVAGEVPRLLDVRYLEAVVERLGDRFDSIAIETGTFDEQDYRRLVRAGVDGLTLYQETYVPDVYRRVHRAGPKASYDRRLLAIEAAGRAGFRSLGVGALLGLAPFRLEAVRLAMHARSLQRRHWQSRVAVSFPRIRHAEGGFVPSHPVGDGDLVQLVCVMRLALPDAELVLSTREPAPLRDALVPLGITRMSAGSRTNPGGYTTAEASGEQFAIEDSRSVAEIVAMLRARGVDPVFKDFDRALVRTGTFE